MKVDRFGRSGSATASRQSSHSAASTGNSGFANALNRSSAGPSSVQGSGAVTSMQAILAAQEVSDSGHRRERALSRGRSILDELQDLHRALVTGELSAAQVGELASLARSQGEKVDDPDLQAILTEIEVRAEVELAKLGR